jgi:hypothetical protein
MSKDVQMRVRQCKACGVSKPDQKTKFSLLAPDQPFQISSWITWFNFLQYGG